MGLALRMLEFWFMFENKCSVGSDLFLGQLVLDTSQSLISSSFHNHWHALLIISHVTLAIVDWKISWRI
jgi:hypothetical protein